MTSSSPTINAVTPTDDVIRLIEAAKAAGVSELEAGGVKLKFGPTEVKKVAPPIIEQDPEEAAKTLAEHELQLKQDQLERLRLEDPYEYEQLIHQDELTNGKEADS